MKKMRLLSEYEVISSIPGVIRAKVNGEGLTVRVFPVPVHVFESDGKISVQLTAVITADTDRQRPGEICAPQKMLTHNDHPPQEVEVVSKPRLEIRAGDRTLEITLEITNLTVFPDLRDQSGSPCVTVSWVAFQSAK